MDLPEAGSTNVRRWVAKARAAAGLARFVAGRYQRDGASRMAASLSYTSLLSLVPLLAIALAMLAAFPVFDEVRAQLLGWVFANFVPAVGEAVQTQVGRFIANAGRLTAAGVVGLAVTAIMLLVTIEGAFNAIFRVARPRSPLSKVLVYWTVLTLGPLLIGSSLSLQGYLSAGVSQSVAKVVAAPLPTLLSILAFAVLYLAVPNRRVRLRDALAGGVAAGLLFAVLRWGFGLYVTSTKAYASVYGAMATVPIFLFWMLLSWAVVLAGAELAAALPEWRAGYRPGDGRRGAGARRLALALEVLSILYEGAASGTGGVSRRTLLQRTGVAEAELAGVLRRLGASGFTAPTTGRRTVLARDLATATLADLVTALDLELSLDEAIGASSFWRKAAEERIAAAAAGSREELAVALRDLLFEPESERET